MACLAIAGATALPAFADSTDELARLQQELMRMREALQQLDARIRALEGAAADRAEKQPTSSFVAVQRNWSEIRPGLPLEKVDALLGKPERVMRVNGDLVWYYVYPSLGRGSVFFSADGRVSAAQAPRIGWSW